MRLSDNGLTSGARRGRQTGSAGPGPGAPQSPPGPELQERWPRSAGGPAPGPGCRSPPERSPSRSSGAPETRRTER